MVCVCVIMYWAPKAHPPLSSHFSGASDDELNYFAVELLLIYISSGGEEHIASQQYSMDFKYLNISKYQYFVT